MERMIGSVMKGGCALVLVLVSACVQAQRFYPEDLRHDVETIRNTLHQAHPDPYRYRTKAELDRIVDQVQASFTVPLDQEELIRVLRPVFHAVGDAHTWLAPSPERMQAYERQEPLIPLRVKVIHGEVHVQEEPKGFRSLEIGSRVLSINGRPMIEVLNELRDGLVADGGDTTFLDRTIEQQFPVLYRRWIGNGTTFDLELLSLSGERSSQRLFALTGEEMERTQLTKGIELKAWRLEDMPEINASWITLSTLDRQVLEKEGVVPERFLTSAADAMRKNGRRTLVLDLRGAGGVDLGMAEEVFSIIAQEPYRVVSAMSVRSTAVPDAYAYSAPAPEFYASVHDTYLPDRNGTLTLRPDDPRLRTVAPYNKAFQGKVYVIADGLTREAGAALVMLAKRTARARIVGEETGSNALSFCGGRELLIELPRTGGMLHVPLTRFVPEGIVSGPVDRGELPHHAVEQQAWYLARGKDAVRVSLIEMIRELQ